MSHSPEEMVGAQISHSLALLLSTSVESHHNGEFILRHRPGLDNMHEALIRI